MKIASLGLGLGKQNSRIHLEIAIESCPLLSLSKIIIHSTHTHGTSMSTLNNYSYFVSSKLVITLFGFIFNFIYIYIYIYIYYLLLQILFTYYDKNIK